MHMIASVRMYAHRRMWGLWIVRGGLGEGGERGEIDLHTWAFVLLSPMPPDGVREHGGL